MTSLRSKVWAVICALLPFHAASWHAEKEPIRELLKSSSTDELTKTWLEKMDKQLNTISVTSALISGVVVTALAWPSISIPQGEAVDAPPGYSSWPVKSLWYISLLFALTSICTATNQAVALHRLSCYSDSCKRTKDMLRKGNSMEPDFLQMWVWQIPIAFLNGSVYFFVAGVAVLAWDTAKVSNLAVQAPDTKTLIVFMVGLVFCITNYVLGTYGLYGKIGKGESSIGQHA